MYNFQEAYEPLHNALLSPIQKMKKNNHTLMIHI